MKKTKVVHINSPHDVYIGRGSLFGNPYKIGVHGNRSQVIDKYKKYLKEKLLSSEFKSEFMKLDGKVLGCHCKPFACHGDVIKSNLESMNSPLLTFIERE